MNRDTGREWGELRERLLRLQARPQERELHDTVTDAASALSQAEALLAEAERERDEERASVESLFEALQEEGERSSAAEAERDSLAAQLQGVREWLGHQPCVEYTDGSLVYISPAAREVAALLDQQDQE